MLLSVSGRRTGRRYTFPVQYVEDGGLVWVYAGGDSKTWWRNLVGNGEVNLWLRRRSRTGHATVCTPDDGAQPFEVGLRRYRERFPGTARRLGLTAAVDDRVPRQAHPEVMIRIELNDDDETSR